MIKEFFPSNLDFISANAIGYFSSAFLVLFVAATFAGYYLFRGERKARALIRVRTRGKESPVVIRRPSNGRR
jgi:hypothetical protein